MEWDYDALGNWTGVEVDNVNQARTHNAQNQITGISGAVTPTYDANGNMTGDETGRVFAYDAWNRLVSVSDDEENVLKLYEYDGLGRRVRELPTGEDAVDLFYSAGWQVLEEHVDEEWYANYVWSPVYVDALILRDRDDERLYSLHDVQFNVVALVDDGGDVVERYVYDAFGAVTVLSPTYTVIGASTVGWVIGFQGMRYDEVSGLSHQRARWYSATLGRWVTTDPILFAAGDNNFYRFVENGPGNWLDPNGLTKGGKQNIKPSELSGKETADQIEKLIDKLIAEGVKGERIKKLKGWLKVVKRGGTFGCVVTVVLATPEIATAAQQDGAGGAAKVAGGVAGDILVGVGTSAAVGIGLTTVTTVTATAGGTAVTGVVASTGVGGLVIGVGAVGYGIGDAIGGIEVGGQEVPDHIADGIIWGLDNLGLW